MVDLNFQDYVRVRAGQSRSRPAPDEPVLAGGALDAARFLEVFGSQLISRHLDLMARVIKRASTGPTRTAVR